MSLWITIGRVKGTYNVCVGNYLLLILGSYAHSFSSKTTWLCVWMGTHCGFLRSSFSIHLRYCYLQFVGVLYVYARALWRIISFHCVLSTDKKWNIETDDSLACHGSLKSLLLVIVTQVVVEPSARNDFRNTVHIINSTWVSYDMNDVWFLPRGVSNF